MDNKKIQDIVLSLKAKGIELTPDDISNLIDPVKIKAGGVLHDLSEKMTKNISDFGTESAKSNIVKEEEEREKIREEFMKPSEGFNRKKGESSLAEKNRIAEMPSYVKDSRLNRITAEYNRKKQLNNQLANLEINSAEVVGQEFRIVEEENVENHLAQIQQGIGAYNEYNKKYRVLQSLKNKGQPSLELTERKL